MGTVGTIARDPSVVPISVPVTSTILRGHGVTVDAALKTARVLGATTEKLYGFAVMDADTDVGYVSVAAGKGGFTVYIKPTTAVVWAVGDVVYYDSTALAGTFTNVVGTGVGATPLGWIVDNRVDAYGCLEMAMLSA
jgi:hypothetical protein